MTEIISSSLSHVGSFHKHQMPPSEIDGRPTQTGSPLDTYLGLPDKSIFPDGIRTSGQHPPILSQLKAFEEYPPNIEGPTVWTGEYMRAHSEEWIHRFTKEELEELEKATDDFIASKEPLIAISKDKFPLPKMSPYLAELYDEILNGKGFVLLKGLPLEAWGRNKASVAFMGISLYLGYLICQNSDGLLLGHITNQGVDPNQLHKIKISRTNAPQFFHTDECDIVGLLCFATALSGGESGCCSAHTVYNVLRKERPDVLKTLCSDIWYVDRKGEVSVGQEPYIRIPIFLLEPNEKGRVYVKWDPNYVKSLSRFSDKGEIPPLSQAQIEAIEVLERTCLDNALNMYLEVGDMQFISCCHLLHARTGFTDPEPPLPQRHLVRTWMGTPHSEGGWTLPYPDSDFPKRGGIQVNNNPPVARPLVI